MKGRMEERKKVSEIEKPRLEEEKEWNMVINKKKQKKEETKKIEIERKKKEGTFIACRVIIYNVEEKDEDDNEKRKKTNMDIIDKIISGLKLKDTVKVESAFREGKYIKQALRPRPIRVKLENVKQKWQLIGKKKTQRK